jgi:hypothetical protein
MRILVNHYGELQDKKKLIFMASYIIKLPVTVATLSHNEKDICIRMLKTGLLPHPWIS